jgi:hypothetical protein
MAMNATIRRERLAVVGSAEREVSDGLHYAQNSLLSEIPGAVVGLITVFYIVTSLVALA